MLIKLNLVLFNPAGGIVCIRPVKGNAAAGDGTGQGRRNRWCGSVHGEAAAVAPCAIVTCIVLSAYFPVINSVSNVIDGDCAADRCCGIFRTSEIGIVVHLNLILFDHAISIS